MLTPDLACWLIARLQAEQVTSFEMRQPDGMLKLQFARRQVGAVHQAGAPSPAEHPATSEASPGMGYVHLKHPLLAHGVPCVGDAISKGTVFAMLAVDELLSPIEASRDGVIAKVLVSDGQLVGYGAALIEWE